MSSKFLRIRNIMLVVSVICLLLFFLPIYIVEVDITKLVPRIASAESTKMLSCMNFILEDTYHVSSVIVFVFLACLVALSVFLFSLENMPKVSQKVKGIIIITLSVVGLILWGSIRQQLAYSMSISMLYLSVKTTPVPLVEYILLIVLAVMGVACSLDLLRLDANLITSISEFFWGISTGMKLERERYRRERQEFVDEYSKMLLDNLGDRNRIPENSLSEKENENTFSLSKRIKYCPSCGEAVSNSSTFCCYCGKDIRKEIGEV